MLNKRLLGLIPNLPLNTLKAVAFQWLGLLFNIIITFIFAFILEGFYKNSFNLTYIMLIAVLVLCKLLFTKLYIDKTAEIARKAKNILRNLVFKKLTLIGTDYRANLSTAEVLQVSVEGVEQLEAYFSGYIPQLFYSLISTLTLFIVFAFIDFKVALVFIVAVPIIPLSIVFVQRLAKRLLKKYWKSYTSLGDSFLDNIQGLTTLKIYGCDDIKHKQMNENAELFRKATMQVLIMQLNSISIMDLVAFGGAATGIAIALLQLSYNNISLRETIIIILLSAEFFIPLRQLGSFFHIAMNGAAAADKLFNILDIKPCKIDNPIYNKEYNITVKDLSFGYDSSIQVLKNININIDSPGLYALVGESGCGKSTLAGLISGRLKGYSGNISLGYVNINSIPKEELSKQITLVSHNSHIFKGSVEYNLRMGKPDATEAEIFDVLKQVNLYDLFMSEKGLDTKITEGGTNLSGGQRQRLALARALLHNSPVYIFDETTSNIDVESENNILKIIEEIAKEKYVIFITHRLSAIKNAKGIFVFNQGEICEVGNHPELIEKGKVYHKLYTAQQELEQLLKAGEVNEN